MSAPLSSIRSREVSELPDGVSRTLRFSGVSVMDLSSGQEVFLQGPLDIHKYGEKSFSLVSPRTGLPVPAKGVTFHVSEEDGKDVDKPLNVISRRLLEQLIPDLEDGSYLTTVYRITASGPPPNTTYEVVRIPLGP